MSKEYAHNDVPGKQRQIGSTVSYAKRGLTDQALHTSALHGRNDISRPLLSESRPNRACANGYEYAFVSRHNALYRIRIQHIATNNGQARMPYVLDLGRITGKSRNRMVLVESLNQQLSSSAAG